MVFLSSYYTLNFAQQKQQKGVEMKRNARKEAGILNPTTNNFIELDIYIPELKLALEFQVSVC